MAVLSNKMSRIVVRNMGTVAVMPHTAVLAVSQLSEPVPQLHRRRLQCPHRLHHPHQVLHPHRPHRVLLPHPLGLRSVQMELVEAQVATLVKDQPTG